MTTLERVNEGIKYLNQTYPGWLSKVDLNTLDMEIGNLCILGQVTGEPYCISAKCWGQALCFDRGFHTWNGLDSPLHFDTYLTQELEDTWKARIRELRGENT